MKYELSRYQDLERPVDASFQGAGGGADPFCSGRTAVKLFHGAGGGAEPFQGAGGGADPFCNGCIAVKLFHGAGGGAEPFQGAGGGAEPFQGAGGGADPFAMRMVSLECALSAVFKPIDAVRTIAAMRIVAFLLDMWPPRERNPEDTLPFIRVVSSKTHYETGRIESIRPVRCSINVRL